MTMLFFYWAYIIKKKYIFFDIVEFKSLFMDFHLSIGCCNDHFNFAFLLGLFLRKDFDN